MRAVGHERNNRPIFLLSALELEIADDPSARSDLLQLRALCKAADSDAFIVG
jgi:hypothetical protein